MKIALILLSTLITFFAASSAYAAGSCTPVKNADGTISVELYNARGNVVKSYDFPVSVEKRYSGGIVVDRGTAKKMFRGYYRQAVGEAPTHHTRETALNKQWVSHSDGVSAVADVGGCKLSKVLIMQPATPKTKWGYAVSSSLTSPLTLTTLGDE